MTTMAPARLLVPVMHLSSLYRLNPQRFTADLETAMALGPLWITLTEAAQRRNEIRAAIEGTGYRPSFHESRECAAIYNHAAGVRLVGEGEAKAHGPGKGYGARYITWDEYTYRGETFIPHYGHWLAHLDDDPQRVRDHNAMTRIATYLAIQHASGRRISTIQGDVNENDKPGPREDKALGNMATQFRKAGARTIWDERHRHPGTFGPRTIDIIATLDSDRRVSVAGTTVLDVHGDHDLIGAVLGVR